MRSLSLTFRTLWKIGLFLVTLHFLHGVIFLHFIWVYSCFLWGLLQKNYFTITRNGIKTGVQTSSHSRYHMENLSIRLAWVFSHLQKRKSSDKQPRASLIAQLVKNLPAMRETWVWSLGWEDPPEEGKGYPLQYSGLKNSTDCIVHGVTKSPTWLREFHFTSLKALEKKLFDCVKTFDFCGLNKNQPKF